MPRASKSGLRLVASGVPEPLYKAIMEEAEERQVDISVVLIDRLTFSEKYKATPEKIDLMVEKSLDTRPDRIDAALVRLIESGSPAVDKLADHVAMKIAQRQISRQ